MGFDFYDSAGKPNRVRNAFADLPLGSMILYAGTAAPYGWLACDGSAVSRTTYADLFTAIGTNYGVGDGSTTFNLPNEDGTIIYAIPVSSRYFGTNPIGSGIINTSNIADGAVGTSKLATPVGNFGAWTDFTPTLTSGGTQPGLGTNPTLAGRYVQIGKTIHGRFRIAFGSGATSGSGYYYITPPVTVLTSSAPGPVGAGALYDASASTLAVATITYDTATAKFIFEYGAMTSSGYTIGQATVPFTGGAAAGDVIQGTFTYEAA